MQLVSVGHRVLAVQDSGFGEPVVFVQTALTADELVPVANQPSLEPYRRVLYYRRGYGSSSAVNGEPSITSDAEDCRALLAALDIERAHIVGVSYSSAVALQLAHDAPAAVASVVLIEPPPVHTASDQEFRAVNHQLIQRRRDVGPTVALHEFLQQLMGDDWRAMLESLLPGAMHQMERDATTFFDADLPALLTWQFGAQDAHAIGCPVLYVKGTESGPWFRGVRELMLKWLPHAEHVEIEGGDHSLAITHAPVLADAVGSFLSRHPLRT